MFYPEDRAEAGSSKTLVSNKLQVVTYSVPMRSVRKTIVVVEKQ